MLLTDWDLDTALDVSKEEGREEERLRNARAMKEEGFDVSTIARITELPVDVILKL
jgi:hypothetical protein